MSPTTCEFCGGTIRDGQRFVVMSKDKTRASCFCSNYCAAGWGVVRFVCPTRGSADAERPALAERYGEQGSWWREVGGHDD